MKLLRILLFLCMILITNIVWSQGQNVKSTGYADLTGVSEQVAHDNALKLALRDAVEKGLGVWLKSQTEVQSYMVTKDEILSRAEGYVLSYEILKEGRGTDGMYSVTIDAKVSVDKIGADIRQIVGQLKTQLSNPSITFVLTTWEKRGMAETYVSETKDNISIVGKIDETLWKKIPDMAIIDAFQQEFKEKGFDLKAADKAREIAMAPSLNLAGIDPSDRAKVKSYATKEGANFVARGEVQIISQSKDNATGMPQVTAKIGTEIIDVNSGDVVASYSNTASGVNASVDEAKFQAIKKAAVLAGRTLADQTIQTWQERANNGRQYTIEILNVTNSRMQKLPFQKAIKSIASISSQASPSETVILYNIVYKGSKEDLEEAVYEALGDTPGFSDSEFQGQPNVDGKLIFKFTK